MLGRSGPFPRAGEACSGYLVSAEQTHILLDCGAGVLSRLRSVLPIERLDAVVLSHLHYDHCSDMSVLRYALEQLACAPLPVYCPAEPAEARAIFDSPVFQLHPLQDGMTAGAGALSFCFHAVKHPVPAFSVRMESGGKTLFYTGDTGWFDALAEMAADADMLLADCCFTDADGHKPNIHLSARQAGSLAKAARAKVLCCTHLFGGADTDAAVQKEVDFAPAVVVKEGRSYRI